MPKVRTRLAVALVSAAVVGLELALMRAFSLRFWHHFAYMVISVALLGFGASGTALLFLRRWIAGRERTWLACAAILFAVSIPAAFCAAGAVPVNVQFLAWDPRRILNVAVVELLILVPFFLGASCIGIALTDLPERLSGHYAANLAGSGGGAIFALVSMWHLDIAGLFVAMSVLAFAGGALVLPWRRARAAAFGAASLVALAALSLALPLGPRASQYKAVSLLQNMPGTRFLHRAEGPLGRIDAAVAPAFHYAPGVRLGYEGPVPPHTLLLGDGEVLGAIYDARRREDWRFLDETTGALAWHLGKRTRSLIMGAGGGAGIGLALYHQSPSVTAVEMNPQVISAMTGPLAARGGRIYQAPGVEIVNASPRGFLAWSRRTFDLVTLSAGAGAGASGAGVQAAQESYLYTLESFSLMLDRLAEGGILSVTSPADSPPRVALRVFDTAAEALRRRGLDPAERLAMVRSWATVTLVASETPLAAEDVEKIEAFCDARGFDLCYLPGLPAARVNRFHVLERPYYWEAARELLGPSREEFLRQYPFEVRAVTDDRPYFFHFFTLRSLRFLREQLGGRSRAFLEVGYLLLLAALVQTVLMAAVFIVLPLAARLKSLVAAQGKGAASVYFVLLGAGFMLLEVCFLQKFILYLAHPVYSGAAVISGFLVFAGLGSLASGLWRARPARVAAAAAAAVVGISLFYLLALDGWLSLTQSRPQAVRFVVACATIAPLAFAMGHMFPLGLRQVSGCRGALVPWAWALNGFASVAATLAAPLVAVDFGFSRLALGAVLCYALAGWAFMRLPGVGAVRAE